jgi:citrate lyase subunit beta/citryl-CoA lyase
VNPVIRSWLYVPADRPGRVANALRGAADAVILDLEDAVAEPAKATALGTALAIVAEPIDRPTLIRINQPATGHGARELRALAAAPKPGLAGIRVPKSERPDQLREVAELLGVPVFPIIETALGVERAFALATAHELVAGISLGEADLAADLRCGPEGLSWPRSRLVTAARAAGLPSPPQSVWTDLRDLDGLRRSTAAGRAAGFFGRSVIHPDQVAVVHEACRPSETDVAAARALIDRLATEGDGAWVDRHGRFVDRAVVERARRVLHLVPDDDPTGAPR